MNKIDLLIGFLIGVVTTVIGSFLFISFATEYEFIDGFTVLAREGYLNKLVALGAILNLPIFYYFIKKEQDLKAKGMLLQALILTIITLFI